MAGLGEVTTGAVLGSILFPVPIVGGVIGAAVGAAASPTSDPRSRACEEAYGPGAHFDPASGRCIAPREILRAIVVAAQEGDAGALRAIGDVVQRAAQGDPEAIAVEHELAAAQTEITRAAYVAKWVHGSDSGRPMRAALVGRLADGQECATCRARLRP